MPALRRVQRHPRFRIQNSVHDRHADYPDGVPGCRSACVRMGYYHQGRDGPFPGPARYRRAGSHSGGSGGDSGAAGMVFAEKDHLRQTAGGGGLQPAGRPHFRHQYHRHHDGGLYALFVLRRSWRTDGAVSQRSLRHLYLWQQL